MAIGLGLAGNRMILMDVVKLDVVKLDDQVNLEKIWCWKIKQTYKHKLNKCLLIQS